MNWTRALASVLLEGGGLSLIGSQDIGSPDTWWANTGSQDTTYPVAGGSRDTGPVDIGSLDIMSPDSG